MGIRPGFWMPQEDLARARQRVARRLAIRVLDATGEEEEYEEGPWDEAEDGELSEVDESEAGDEGDADGADEEE